MKKLISLSLALILALTMFAGAALAEGSADEHTIDMKEVPVYMGEEEMGAALSLFFLDGAYDLPYIEADDWLELMQALWNEEGITLETNGSTATYTHSEDNTMVLDFYADTIEFVDYDLFIQNSNANTLLDMLTLNTFNEAGEPALFQRNKSFSFDRYGDVKTLRLGGLQH